MNADATHTLQALVDERDQRDGGHSPPTAGAKASAREATMEISVKKGQESKKVGFLPGKNIKLTLEFDVALSEQDKRLIEKYYAPLISTLCVSDGRQYIRAYYDGTDKAFKVVKVDSEEGNLRKFHLIAHVDDGHAYLGNLQEFEKAVVRALVKNLEHLEAIEQWQGERTLTSQEE